MKVTRGSHGSQPEVSAYGAPPPAAYAPQFMIPAAPARDTPPPEYAPPAPAYQETAPAQYTAYGAQDAAYSAYGEQSAPEPAYAAYGAPPPAAQPAQFMIPSAPAPFQDGPASTTQPAYDTFGGDGGAYGGDGWAGASPQRAPMTSQGDAQQSQHQQQSQYAPSFEGGYSAYGAAGSSHATGDAVLRQDATFFDHAAPGSVSVMLEDAAIDIQEGLSDKFCAAVQGVCQLVAGFAVAFYFGPELSAVLCACVPPMICPTKGQPHDPAMVAAPVRRKYSALSVSPLSSASCASVSIDLRLRA